MAANPSAANPSAVNPCEVNVGKHGGLQGNTGTPVAFFDALNGYQRTAVIKGALELNLFSAIGRGATDVKAIAATCSGSERGVRVLCDTLTVLGFLRKEAERYELTPDTALFLDRASPAYLGDAAEFMLHPRIVDGFTDVAAAVRKGGTMLSGEGTVSEEDSVWESFASGMAAVMRMPAELLAKNVLESIPSPKKILDIAASHGEFGFAFARSVQDAELYALDWPSVLEVTRHRAAAEGLDKRLHLVPGDLFSVPFPTGMDLVLLPNILHHFDRSGCVEMLRRARAALKNGGTVAILEFIPNDDRVSPVGSALFAIIMLCSTPHGDAYTFAEYKGMLEEAGFSDVELRELAPGMQRAMIAWNS